MTARFRLRTAANGALTSIAWSFNAHWSLRGLDAGVALEQTLPVATFMSVIGRVGMSYGLRDDDVQVPSDLDGSGFRDNTIAPPAHLDILRPDLRLEPLIGVVIGSHTFGVLSFQPYFTLAHGSITAVSCNDCVPGVRLVGFAQNFGFAVALTVHGP